MVIQSFIEDKIEVDNEMIKKNQVDYTVYGYGTLYII